MGFLRERFSKSIEDNNHSRIIYRNDNIARLVMLIKSALQHNAVGKIFDNQDQNCLPKFLSQEDPRGYSPGLLAWNFLFNEALTLFRELLFLAVFSAGTGILIDVN